MVASIPTTANNNNSQPPLPRINNVTEAYAYVIGILKRMGWDVRQPQPVNDGKHWIIPAIEPIMSMIQKFYMKWDSDPFWKAGDLVPGLEGTACGMSLNDEYAETAKKTNCIILFVRQDGRILEIPSIEFLNKSYEYPPLHSPDRATKEHRRMIGIESLKPWSLWVEWQEKTLSGNGNNNNNGNGNGSGNGKLGPKKESSSSSSSPQQQQQSTVLAVECYGSATMECYLFFVQKYYRGKGPDPKGIELKMLRDIHKIKYPDHDIRIVTKSDRDVKVIQQFKHMHRREHTKFTDAVFSSSNSNSNSNSSSSDTNNNG